MSSTQTAGASPVGPLVRSRRSLAANPCWAGVNSANVPSLAFGRRNSAMSLSMSKEWASCSGVARTSVTVRSSMTSLRAATTTPSCERPIASRRSTSPPSWRRSQISHQATLSAWGKSAGSSVHSACTVARRIDAIRSTISRFFGSPDFVVSFAYFSKRVMKVLTLPNGTKTVACSIRFPSLTISDTDSSSMPAVLFSRLPSFRGRSGRLEHDHECRVGRCGELGTTSPRRRATATASSGRAEFRRMRSWIRVRRKRRRRIAARYGL